MVRAERRGRRQAGPRGGHGDRPGREGGTDGHAVDAALGIEIQVVGRIELVGAEAAALYGLFASQGAGALDFSAIIRFLRGKW